MVEAHPSISEQLSEAVGRQMERRQQSRMVDRTGWTRKQWIDDARELMNHPDGAITSLVNGHVMAMLEEIDGYPEHG